MYLYWIRKTNSSYLITSNSDISSLYCEEVDMIEVVQPETILTECMIQVAWQEIAEDIQSLSLRLQINSMLPIIFL